MSRLQIILLLLVFLALAIAYSWIASPKQRRIDPDRSLSSLTEQHTQKSNRQDVPVIADLNLSGGAATAYKEPQRNLFGSLYPPPKPVKVIRRPAPRKPKIRKPVPKPRKIVPVVVKPPEPIQPLTVMGFLKKAEEYTIFLSSKEGEVFLVKAGDTFADNLEVRRVTGKEATIAHLKTGQQVVLPLSEGKTQRLPNVRFKSDRPAFEPPLEKPGPQGKTDEKGEKKVKK